MPTYAPANAEAEKIVDETMRRYHDPLVKAGVTVNCLFAYGDNGPAIKLHGYACAAKVKVNSLQDRVEGKSDATITIDNDPGAWREMSLAQRNALIDHELEHLELLRDKKTGAVRTDDHGRPKLKCKLHDWELGGFESVSRRHKEDAPEVIAAQHFRDEFGQLFFWEPTETEKKIKKIAKAASDGIAKAFPGKGKSKPAQPHPTP